MIYESSLMASHAINGHLLSTAKIATFINECLGLVVKKKKRKKKSALKGALAYFILPIRVLYWSVELNGSLT